jgi:hypothetical protein
MKNKFYIIAYYDPKTHNGKVNYKMTQAKTAREAKEEIEKENPTCTICMVTTEAPPDEWQ